MPNFIEIGGVTRKPLVDLTWNDPCVYVFICGGHHDSDHIAVLVMVSKAESIVLYFILYIFIMYTCQNREFLPSFLPSYYALLVMTVFMRGARFSRATVFLSSFC